MFSASTAHALAAQLARLVRSPSARLADRHAPVARGSTDGCGLCPSCGEFVAVEFDRPDGTALCPRCHRAIDDLAPPA